LTLPVVVSVLVPPTASEPVPSAVLLPTASVPAFRAVPPV